MEAIIVIAIFIGGSLVGGFLGFWIRKMLAIKTESSAEAKAEAIVQEAKSKQQEMLLDAKNKSISLLNEAQRDEQERRKEITQAQRRVEKRESMFDQKLIELEAKQSQLQDEAQEIEDAKEEVRQIKQQQVDKLESVAEMNKVDALALLEQRVEEENQEALYSRMKKLQEQASDEIERKAKELMTVVIQRCSTSHAAETTTTMVDLPNDDLKVASLVKKGVILSVLKSLLALK